MKILFSNAWMKNFGGSELVTLELAEEYQSRGWEVLIYSPHIDEPLKSEIKVPTTTTIPNPTEFDIVWNHHNLLTDNWKPRFSQVVVSNHMSSYVAHEFPSDATWENKYCQYIFANSPETRMKMIQLGLTNVDVFPNPAPRSFEPRLPRAEPYALFVSNHRPVTLDVISKSMGIKTRILGEKNEFTRITPEILGDAAFVVCNGKTVQYALRAMVPVFLFDHFDGPGWLTLNNMAHAAAFNFSGRGFPEKAHLSSLLEWRTITPIPHVPTRYKLEKCLDFYGLV